MVPLLGLFGCPWLALCTDPSQEVLVGAAGQYSSLESLGIDPQEFDQMFVEPDGDVVVVLNEACVSHPNLVDEPGKMRDAAKKEFRTPRICVSCHSGSKHTQDWKKSIGFPLAAHQKRVLGYKNFG